MSRASAALKGRPARSELLINQEPGAKRRRKSRRAFHPPSPFHIAFGVAEPQKRLSQLRTRRQNVEEFPAQPEAPVRVAARYAMPTSESSPSSRGRTHIGCGRYGPGLTRHATRWLGPNRLTSFDALPAARRGRLPTAPGSSVDPPDRSWNRGSGLLDAESTLARDRNPEYSGVRLNFGSFFSYPGSR